MKLPYTVNWALESGFCQMVCVEIVRMSRRYGLSGDPFEALSEVWIGLNNEFSEGQTLLEEDVRLLRIIIARRILNYRKSKGARRPKQLSKSLFDDPDLENLKSSYDSPDQFSSDLELFGMIESELSKMPPHWAMAVRSRFGYPGAPEWAEFVQSSGTTRQNLAKHAKRGLEELKRLFA